MNILQTPPRAAHPCTIEQPYSNSNAVFTQNALGILYDPFEFEGDYGEESNRIRQRVFDVIISQEALVKSLSDEEIRSEMPGGVNASQDEVNLYRETRVQEAQLKDSQRGPTLSEMFTPAIIEQLREKLKTLSASDDLEKCLKFLKSHEDKKIFQFLRNNPRELLWLDKDLKDKAAKNGTGLSLPIVGSLQSLQGESAEDLKTHLVDALFSEETLKLAQNGNDPQKSLNKLDPEYLKSYFGGQSSNQELAPFYTPTGQTLFYFLYQSLNFHLIGKESHLIEEVNQVKALFAKTIGDPIARAQAFRDHLIRLQAGVVFTQESDLHVRTALETSGFHSVSGQNAQDGTFVFLQTGLWTAPEPIALANQSGKINLVSSVNRETGEPFLLASCHGDSNNPQNGRDQITQVMDLYKERVKTQPNLQLLIGTDANTKSPKDVADLRAHLDALGLYATEVGATTVKKRMVTVQHNKVGRAAVDEEDFLIALKPAHGGHFSLAHQTAGFTKNPLDSTKALPNKENMSDHYAVGALLYRK